MTNNFDVIEEGPSCSVLRVSWSPKPCGVCGVTLSFKNSGLPITCVIADSLHDTPRIYLDGSVNYYKCTNCGFGAWLWPGFLLLLKREERAILVVSSDHDPALFLKKIREYANRKDFPLSEISETLFEKRLVTVFSYNEVSGLTQLDDHIYFRLATAASAFQSRRYILDFEERIALYTKGAIENELLIFNEEESNDEFVMEAVRSIEQAIKTKVVSTKFRMVFDSFVSNLRKKTRKEDSETWHSAMSRFRLEAPNMQASEQQQHMQPLNPNICKKLIKIKKEFELPKNSELLEELWTTVTDLNFIPSFGDDRAISDEQVKAMSVEINEILKINSDITVSLHNEELPLKQALLLSVSGNIYIQTNVIHQCYVENGKSQAIFLALMRYLMRLVEKTGDRSASLHAHCLFCEYYGGDLSPTIRRAVLARGLCQFLNVNEETGSIQGLLATEHATLVKFAMGVQLMSRAIDANIQPILASELASYCAKIFKLCGRVDGYMMSMVDNIQFRIVVDSPNDVLARANQLKRELLAFKKINLPARFDTLYGDSIRLNLVLARLLFGQTGLPAAGVIISNVNESGCIQDDIEEIRSKILADFTKEIQAAKPDLKIVDSLQLILAPNDSIEDIEKFTNTIEDNKTTFFPNDIRVISHPIETKTTREGIFYQMIIKVRDRLPEVIGAQIHGVAWISEYIEAIVMARTHQNWELWQECYIELVSMLDGPEYSGLAHFILTLYDRERQSLQKSKLIIEDSINGKLRKLLVECQRAIYFDQVEAIRAQIRDVVVDLSENINDSTQVNSINFDWTMTLEQMSQLFEFSNYNMSAATNYLQNARNIILSGTERKLENPLAQKQQSEVCRSNAVIQKNISRAIRCLVKDFFFQEEHHLELLNTVFDLIQCYRRIYDDIPFQSSCFTKSENPNPVVAFVKSNDLPLFELSKYYDTETVALNTILIKGDNLFEGFWLVFAIHIQSCEVLLFHTLGLDKVLEAHARVMKKFKDGDDCLIEYNHVPEDINNELLVALEGFTDLLFPQAFWEEMLSRNIQHLEILPDAYLFDFPWNGLRPSWHDRRQYLFERTPHAILTTISPSCALRKRAFNNRSSEPEKPKVTLLASTDPQKSLGLSKIYGADKALTNLSKYFSQADFELTYKTATRDNFVNALLTSSVVGFFGHGLPDFRYGTHFVTDDGPIGSIELSSLLSSLSVSAKLVITCACYGVEQDGSDIRTGSKMIGPLHILQKSGVDVAVGSMGVLSPQVAMRLLYAGFISVSTSDSIAKNIAKLFSECTNSKRLSSPLLWSRIVCYGPGDLKFIPGR